ncbi:unnamed protein product [Trifolium pratense]|uniref:Uncharacterized protein n=1 Tax=Trifolium pratense TaxID=57577 RepID=A0ACB0LIT9_TRIPR|nr:unnamed protein product [Trifolium pratense]
MATYNNGQFPANLPILDGKNYDSWSKQMKVLFNYQDVMDHVTNSVDPLTEGATENQRTQHKELKKKDFKALFIIHQSFGRFQNRVRVSVTLTMCREDFPYSAKKSDNPRSPLWTDKIAHIAEFRRRKEDERERENKKNQEEEDKKKQEAEIIIISSESESEEDEIDADYAEFLAGYVPEEEQSEEEGPEPIEISSDESEMKSEISSETLSD